jgi:ABC-type thiamine transport system ATPase subunit
MPGNRLWTSRQMPVSSAILTNCAVREQPQSLTEMVRALDALLKRETEENLSNLCTTVKKDLLISSAENLQKLIRTTQLNRYTNFGSRALFSNQS